MYMSSYAALHNTMWCPMRNTLHISPNTVHIISYAKRAGFCAPHSPHPGFFDACTSMCVCT